MPLRQSGRRWSTKKDSRTLERLGHRTAAAGRLKGAEYAFTQGHRSRARICRWLAERGARADTGRRDGARQALHRRRRSRSIRSWAAFTIFKAMIEKADGDYDAALKVAAIVTMPNIRATAWCWNQVAPAPVPEARLQRVDRSAEEGRGCRSGGSADALHGDAGLSRHGRSASAEREQKLFQRFKAEESAQAITAKRAPGQPRG